MTFLIMWAIFGLVALVIVFAYMEFRKGLLEKWRKEDRAKNVLRS